MIWEWFDNDWNDNLHDDLDNDLVSSQTLYSLLHF